MEPVRIRRSLLAIACVAAPLFGLAAALAVPGLQSNRSAELNAITHHQDRFYLYAICILISSYLLVPAVLAVTGLVRQSRGSVIAGLLAQVGLVIAIGDAAVELMYWQMGRPGADHQQMTALAAHYEDAPGAALIYNVGGIAVVVGLIWLGVLLWRSGAVPRWSAAALPLGTVANIVGFGAASQPALAASYVVLGVGFLPVARALRDAHAAAPAPATEGVVVSA
jgi:hypothetical protein